MHLFSQTFLSLLILLSLVCTGLGGTLLLVLLARDWKNNDLW